MLLRISHLNTIHIFLMELLFIRQSSSYHHFAVKTFNYVEKDTQGTNINYFLSELLLRICFNAIVKFKLWLQIHGFQFFTNKVLQATLQNSVKVQDSPVSLPGRYQGLYMEMLQFHSANMECKNIESCGWHMSRIFFSLTSIIIFKSAFALCIQHCVPGIHTIPANQ